MKIWRSEKRIALSEKKPPLAITPKSEDKYVVKMFNWSEVYLFEMTCYKVHTLAISFNSSLANLRSTYGPFTITGCFCTTMYSELEPEK